MQMTREKAVPRREGRRFGFTLIEIMVVVAILGLLLAVAVPNWIKTRTRAQTDICIENLSQIETAKQLWALEKGMAVDDVPEEDDLIGPELYLKKMPECPAGGEYEFERVGDPATCPVEGHVLPLSEGG
jgi:prepilin-type N-terminal cleavage/methylation domain-containing protein